MALFGSLRKPAAAPPAPPPEVPRDINAPNRRAAERYQTAVLSCLLGDIKDLSATGMCVAAKSAPPVPVGMLFEFDLHSPTDSLTVVGRIVRIAKIKGAVGKFDVGIEFQRMTPELTAAVVSLARFGCVKKKLGAAASSAQVTARVQLPDLYDSLGVPAIATPEQLHAAFRDLARRYHPDVNKTPEAQVKFVELLKAYDLLKDPDKRIAYDAARLNSA